MLSCLFSVNGVEEGDSAARTDEETKVGCEERVVKTRYKIGMMDARRVRALRIPSNTDHIIMSSSKLHTLYKQLLRAFTSQPSDLKTSGRLLAELKVSLVCHALGLTNARPSC